MGVLDMSPNEWKAVCLKQARAVIEWWHGALSLGYTGMAKAADFREMVQGFLDEKRSLQELEDWSAAESWNIHKGGDADAQEVAYAICGILAEHSSGDLDDAALKLELVDKVLQ